MGVLRGWQDGEFGRVFFAEVTGGQGREFGLQNTVVPLRTMYPHYDYLHKALVSPFLLFSFSEASLLLGSA